MFCSCEADFAVYFWRCACRMQPRDNGIRAVTPCKLQPSSYESTNSVSAAPHVKSNPQFIKIHAASVAWTHLSDLNPDLQHNSSLTLNSAWIANDLGTQNSAACCKCVYQLHKWDHSETFQTPLPFLTIIFIRTHDMHGPGQFRTFAVLQL